MSRSKQMLRGAGGVAIISLLIGGAIPRVAQAQHAAANVTVKIGISIPLLQYPALAQGIENGVKIAVAEANTKNTVPGVTFAAEPLDDTVNNVHDPAKEASNARTLIADTSVIADIGPLNSSSAQASMAVYNNAGMVQISSSNTLVELTDPKFRGKYEPRAAAGKGPITYFRTASSDAYQGKADALFAVRTLHAKRVFVVDNKGSYGVGLANGFESSIKALGATVLGHSQLDATQPKLGADAVAANIASQSGGNVDLVYFGGEYDSNTGGGTFLADALKAHGLKAFVLGGDGIKDPAFISASTNGGVLTGYASTIGPDPTTYPPAASYRAMESKMFPGVALSIYDIQSYDAAKVVITAYASAVKQHLLTPGQVMNISSRTTLAKLVGATKNFAGASGVFSFDANGDTTNSVFSLYKVTGTGKSAKWSYIGLAPTK